MGTENISCGRALAYVHKALGSNINTGEEEEEGREEGGRREGQEMGTNIASSPVFSVPVSETRTRVDSRVVTTLSITPSYLDHHQ